MVSDNVAVSGGHTPGPWTTEDRCDGGYVREATPWDETGGIKRRKAVALVRVSNRTDEENYANARLIAAAPTMRLFIEQAARNGDPEATAILEAIDART